MNSLALLLHLPLLFAGTVSAPGTVDPQGPELIVRGGTLFDSETGVRRPLGQLWIESGKILEEKPIDAPIPSEVRVIDAEGMTLVPGLFDLHCHIAVPGGPMTQRILLPARQNLAGQIYCGITHVVDLHADETSIFALSDASRTDANLARLYSAGAAFTAPGGHGTQFGLEANAVTSIQEVDQRFERLLAHHPDVIKGILEHGDWGGLPEMPTLSAELVDALGARARGAHLPFFCHIWTLDEAKTATHAGATALAHGVFLGAVDNELIEAMKAQGCAYIPTLSVVLGALDTLGGSHLYGNETARGALRADLYGAINDPGLAHNPSAIWAQAFTEEDIERVLSNLRRVFEAGVPVGLGTDAGNPLTPHGPSAIHELELFVRAGLTPGEALQCATLGSARILGVDDRFGSLEPGKIADIVFVRGDPTADIARMWEIDRVLKAGVPVDREAIRKANAEFLTSRTVSVAGEDVDPEIDGFEDGDAICPWGGTWTTLTDSVASGKSEGTLELSRVDGNGIARLVGSVNQGFQWGPWSGLTVDWSDGGSRVVDASDYTGIRLRIRGTRRPTTISLLRAAVKDFNVFSRSLEVGPEWAEIELPFSSFHQIGFGKSVASASDDLTGLSLDARNNPFGGESVFGPFELELDWIRLYR